MLPSVRYTYDFVRAWLPGGTERILEIGCGSGELAAALAADGFQVIAIDSDPECAAQARSRGVDARLMIWPGPLNGRFDAILFTRSLHHVEDLAGSVAAAAEALNPGGRIIVEDFRAEGGSERSARWFEELVRELDASGGLSSGTTVAALLDKAAPSSSHDHHLHSSSEIRRALGSLGEPTEADSAYYFRYLEPHLTKDEAERILRLELALIADNSIDPLGKRFVAPARM